MARAESESGPRKRLAVFGATGSVGRSTLALVRAQPERYTVNVLTAHRDERALAALAQEFRPQVVALADPAAASSLRAALDTLDDLDTKIEVLHGPQGLLDAAAADYDLMVAAIVGFAGLAPTYRALQLGRSVALANKEALVCAGPLMIAAARQAGATLLPVDSEHNALFQCWETHNRSAVQSVQLTGSGGPFRGWRPEQIAAADLSQALAHPKWSMGPKISLDSATLMNKALEMIEARWLFDLKPEQIEVVIHPQSIVHSCVTYTDGALLAQLGQPDMRTPLAYCLAYPERAAQGGTPLRLTDLKGLTFEPPDEYAFPTLGLARAALTYDTPAASLTLNVANEVFNEAVRARALPFGQLIPRLVTFMDKATFPDIPDMADLQALDQEVRAKAGEAAARMDLVKWT